MKIFSKANAERRQRGLASAGWKTDGNRMRGGENGGEMVGLVAEVEVGLMVGLVEIEDAWWKWWQK